MAENTKIEWTDHTMNPWLGCSRVAPGCQNCYAEACMDKRLHRVKWGANGTRVKTSEANWREPLKWNKQAEAEGVRRRVFCASHADVFEDWRGPILDSRGEVLYKGGDFGRVGGADPLTMADLRRDLFELIDSSPHLAWLLVTKRPENIRDMLRAVAVNSERQAEDRSEFGELYRRNVWLLTSISDQETAERNIPELLKCRDLSPVLGISAEPLLDHVQLDVVNVGDISSIDCLAGHRSYAGFGGAAGRSHRHASLDWVIIGGESGPGARPFYVEHGESLLRQCRDAGVPAFMKQIGAMPVTSNANLRDFPPHVQELDDFGDGGAASCRYKLRHAKGGDPDEWPEDLRVRQFPTT